MKKIISLLSALALIASMAVSPAYADDTVFEKSLTVQQGVAATEDISSYGFTGDTVFEVDYDFVGKSVPEGENVYINLPFVFKNSAGAEIVRFSIVGDGDISDVDYLRTRFEYIDSTGKFYNSGDLCAISGFVEKKGKLTFLFSNMDRKLYVQYKGENLKTDGYMGWAPFTYSESKENGYTVDTESGVAKLTIGSSSCAETSINVKAYAVSDASAYKIPYAKYNYETARTGYVKSLFASSGYSIPVDFRNSSDNVEIKAEENGNHYLYIPSGSKYHMMFAPQYRGIEEYSDYTYIKWKQKVASAEPSFTGTKDVETGAYEGTKTKLSMVSANQLKLKNTTVTVPSLTDGWVDVMQVYDNKNGKVSVYVNGERYATEIYNNLTGIGLNTMVFTFDNDMCIDDLEMGEYTPTLADKTFKESYTVASGVTTDKDISDYASAQTVIEVEYDLSNADTEKMNGNFNIPIILRSSSDELGRFSIQDSTVTTASTYFQTNFGNTNLENLGGLIGKTGTIKILADTNAKKYWVKYVGTGMKTEQYMGWGTLKEGTLTTVRIGAGGNPGISVTTKAYPADGDIVKEFKNFKSVYTYDDVTYTSLNTGYLDFKYTGAGVTVSDGVVNVPKGNLFRVMLTPQKKGWEDKFVVSYKVKYNGNSDTSKDTKFSDNKVFVTNYGDTIGATRTQAYDNRVGFAGLKNTSAVIDNGVEYGDMPYSISDGWKEFKQVIDLENHTADLYIDGWYMVTRQLDSNLSYINSLEFTFNDCDVQLDDIKVEAYTNDTVKNTAKLYIGTLSNGDYRVWASYVDANADSNDTVSVIAASYDTDNKLVIVNPQPIVNKSTAGATISGTDVKTIKGFMWKDGSLQPLCNSVFTTVAADN